MSVLRYPATVWVFKPEKLWYRPASGKSRTMQAIFALDTVAVSRLTNADPYIKGQESLGRSLLSATGRGHT